MLYAPLRLVSHMTSPRSVSLLVRSDAAARGLASAVLRELTLSSWSFARGRAVVAPVFPAGLTSTRPCRCTRLSLHPCYLRGAAAGYGTDVTRRSHPPGPLLSQSALVRWLMILPLLPIHCLVTSVRVPLCVSTSTRPCSCTHPSMRPCCLRDAAGGCGNGVTWSS